MRPDLDLLPNDRVETLEAQFNVLGVGITTAHTTIDKICYLILKPPPFRRQGNIKKIQRTSGHTRS